MIAASLLASASIAHVFAPLVGLVKHASPAQIATPAFVALAIAEAIFLSLTGGRTYDPRDTATSFAMGIGNALFGALYGLILAWFASVLWPLRIATISWSFGAAALCFIFDDLLFYWWHRAAHRVRWIWAEHVNHHSSQFFNLSTAFRQPWGNFLTPSFLFKAPILLIGFPPAMVALAGGLNLAYQFWLHTETIGKLPRWFERVMNTPSHHRIHHAVNPRYLDRNYGGTFIIWDRFFGTFELENDLDKPRYGLVKNLDTFNPLRVASHEFVALAKDLWRSRAPREALAYLFGPPGWSPDGSRQTSDSIRARWRAQASTAAPAE